MNEVTACFECDVFPLGSGALDRWISVGRVDLEMIDFNRNRSQRGMYHGED
jgi:hypothetical protein